MPSIKLCPAKGYISRKLDVFSENDCYVVFTLGSQKEQTTVKVDQAVPEWDQWFEFHPEGKNLLNISVMDEDQVLHEEIGSTVLDLTPYFNNPCYDQFFVRIKHEGEQAAGKVVMKVMPADGANYQKVGTAPGSQKVGGYGPQRKGNKLLSNEHPEFYDPRKHPVCKVDRQNLAPPDHEQLTRGNSTIGRTEPSLGTQPSSNLGTSQIQNGNQNYQNQQLFNEQQERSIKAREPNPDQAVSNQYMPFHTVKLGNNVGHPKQVQTDGRGQQFRSQGQPQYNLAQQGIYQPMNNSRIYSNIEMSPPVTMPMTQVISNGYAPHIQYNHNLNGGHLVSQTMPAQYAYSRPEAYYQFNPQSNTSSRIVPSQQVSGYPRMMMMQSPIKPTSQVRNNYPGYASPSKTSSVVPQYLTGQQFLQPQPAYYVQYPR